VRKKGKGKREEGRGKREEGRGKREETPGIVTMGRSGFTPRMCRA